MFPLLLIIPTLRKITPFMKRKRKIIFELKIQEASPALTHSLLQGSHRSNLRGGFL